ncbi:MAG: hypothetical protein R3C59_15890 [Planctomycetaceae bacterium]
MKRSARYFCITLAATLLVITTGDWFTACRAADADETIVTESSDTGLTPSQVTNRLIFAPAEQPPAGAYSALTLSSRSRPPRVTPKLDKLQQQKQASLEELHNKAARLVNALKEKKAQQEKAAAAQAAADRARALQEKAAAEKAAAEQAAAEKAMAEQRRLIQEQAAAEKAFTEQRVADRERSIQNKIAVDKVTPDLQTIRRAPGQPLQPVELPGSLSLEPTPLKPTGELPLAHQPLSIPSLPVQPAPPAFDQPVVEAPVVGPPVLPEIPAQTADVQPTDEPPTLTETEPTSDPPEDSPPVAHEIPMQTVDVTPASELPSAELPAAESPPVSSQTPALTADPVDSSAPVIDGPIDRMALATSLFATEQFAGCLKALEAVDLETLNSEKRDWHRYMTACCLRKQGKLSDAESQYRKLLSQSETQWLTEAAKWWLDHLNEQHKLQEDLALVNSTLDTWQKEINALQNPN